MSAAIRDQVRAMNVEASELALKACLTPRSERDYLIICGKVQQLIANAAELKKRFLEPQQRADDAESGLPDDDYDPEGASPAPRRPQATPPRRVQPQSDRLTQHRERHRPRQY